MATLNIQGVAKSFGETRVLHRVDLDIADGEFIVLVGPSGCGKSTLLRCIAGLEQPTEGRIRIGDRDVTNLPPRDRDVAMVFQSYALYPHMTVRENMGFALKIKGASASEIDAAVQEAARMLELGPLLDRKPAQLSGGQRQRVAIGRCIVRRPAVFLFDEPLSNLDAVLRTQMRVELKRLHRSLGATMVYVTHDQVEAMTLADRLVVLYQGIPQQIGSPAQVHDTPSCKFVAGFIGSPPMNFLLKPEPGLVLGVRPHNVILGEGPHRARVDVTEPLGAECLVHLDLQGEHLVARAETAPPSGEIQVAFRKVHRFDPNSERALP